MNKIDLERIVVRGRDPGLIYRNRGIDPVGNNPLPNSRKVYVAGQLHPDLRVPFREISLAPTKTMSGEIEVNEPVRVYDTSGPWGDADQKVDVTEGLPPLRAKWIRDRGDVEEIEGRTVTPHDDGYLSEKHAASALTPTERERPIRMATAATDSSQLSTLNINSA